MTSIDYSVFTKEEALDAIEHLNARLKEIEEIEKSKKGPYKYSNTMSKEEINKKINDILHDLKDPWYRGDCELHWASQSDAKSSIRYLWLWQNEKIDDINTLNELQHNYWHSKYTKSDNIPGYWEEKNELLRAEMKRNHLKELIDVVAFETKIDEERFKNWEHIKLLCSNQVEWTSKAPNWCGEDEFAINCSKQTKKEYEESIRDLADSKDPEKWKSISDRLILQKQKHLKEVQHIPYD